MASSKKNDLISKASRHTIKKFELIEAYTKEWARKLLEYGVQTDRCDGIVFIDCMSNSGLYISEETGESVEGTPIRVARALESIMREERYQSKDAYLYFSDLSEEKIALLSVNCTNAVFRQVPKLTSPAGSETQSGAS